jgi:transketolase
MNLSELQTTANEIRKHSLRMVYLASSGHIGGSLGIADVITALYFNVMSEDDKFVLSKGHCSPALYSVLALKGKFPVEKLDTFRQIDSYLQGHPSMGEVPGVDMSTGSLGQGISAACGIALAAKMDASSRCCYAVLGDGETQEGQVWEAAMFAAHYKLDNLCAIIDYNGLQIDGEVEEVMGIAPLADKWRAFGWNVIEIDGHNFEEIIKALSIEKNGKPTAIIARTIKGKGVSFMENNPDWHGTAPNKEQYELGMSELS